jgi:hypothetical protein
MSPKRKLDKRRRTIMCSRKGTKKMMEPWTDYQAEEDSLFKVIQGKPAVG